MPAVDYLVTLLISYKADEQLFNLALLKAAKAGDKETVHLLIEHGADPTEYDTHLAAERACHTQVAEFLKTVINSKKQNSASEQASVTQRQQAEIQQLKTALNSMAMASNGSNHAGIFSSKKREHIPMTSDSASQATLPEEEGRQSKKAKLGP